MIDDLQNKVEAVLFAAGRMVSLDELAALCKTTPGFIKEALKELKQKFSDDSPIILIEEGDGWKFSVREKYLDLVKNITPHMEMGKPVLETLAVIAWKQPVLQAEVINIRGSGAYEHIATLEELGFLRKEKFGRSFMLKTTEKFQEYFDLPTKEAIKQIFKDIQEQGEQQQKLAEQQLGPLEVYETTPVEEADDGLEIVSYPEEKRETEENVSETEGNDTEETSEEQQDTEEQPAEDTEEERKLHPKLESYLKEE